VYLPENLLTVWTSPCSLKYHIQHVGEKRYQLHVGALCIFVYVLVFEHTQTTQHFFRLDASPGGDLPDGFSYQLWHLEYFCNFSQKNDHVPIFCWTLNIFTIFIWENNYVPIFCWTWNIFAISLEKTTMFLAGLRIFLWFLSKKRLCSNILLDFEYFHIYLRKQLCSNVLLVRIFSHFYLRKRPCSNVLLDLDYFSNFCRKNDQVQQNIGT